MHGESRKIREKTENYLEQRNFRRYTEIVANDIRS